MAPGCILAQSRVTGILVAQALQQACHTDDRPDVVFPSQSRRMVRSLPSIFNGAIGENLDGPLAEVLTLLLIAAALAAAVSILAGTLRTGISPMPTLPAVRRTLLAALPPPERVGAGPVHELGAGWGGLALALARRYPAARVVAHELSALPWAVCALRARLAGLGPQRLAVHRADFLAASLADARLVVCYLDPANMTALRPRFEAQLPPGALVVSSTFAVPGWQPSAVRHAADWQRSPVYVYERPRVVTQRPPP
jgi:hypothetical protein